jgi:hypothetical protein
MLVAAAHSIGEAAQQIAVELDQSKTASCRTP